MDEANPLAEAIAIYGSRITAVGETSEIERVSRASTKVIDLHGKTVIPGFIDSHIHFTSYALRFLEVNLDSTASIEDALVNVKRRVEA